MSTDPARFEGSSSLPLPRTQGDAPFMSAADYERATGIEPFSRLDDLPRVDPFGSDEEHEAFLADLYASRRSDS